MASPRDFAKRMRQISNLIVTNTEAAWRATALAVDQTVVLATPVDTGRARSNWRVQAGSAPAGVIDPYAPGEKGSTVGANSQAALEQGKAAIASASGDTLYISNNLEYIGALNDGHSAQAPAGFVELAVQAGINTVAKMKVTE